MQPLSVAPNCSRDGDRPRPEPPLFRAPLPISDWRQDSGDSAAKADAAPAKAVVGEHHLFVLWEAARGAETRILEDLRRSFEILCVREVHWSAARVSDNYSRFYGLKLPPGSFKEEHCGRGPLLAALVRDPAPRYALRQTSKGQRRVNVNTFDAKQRYRQWTGGGHRVHATDTESETHHDVALLFGVALEALLAALPPKWDGQMERLHADLAGAEGWRDLRQFFAVLNETVRYLVLRNYEWLPDQFSTAEHGDIDLLTDSAEEVAFAANARKVFPEAHRVHYAVRIGGREVRFDFRQRGDGYYDPAWAEAMLANRTWNARGFYVPATEDYFYSLLYHALVHKPQVAPDYVAKLADLAASLKLVGVDDRGLAEPRRAKRWLDVWLQGKGYAYWRPADPSVYFNEALLRAVPARIIQRVALDQFPPVGAAETLLSARLLTEHQGRRYFSLVWEGPQPGTVTKQATGNLAWREAQLLQRLSGPCFPRVLDARQEADWSVVVLERIDGIELAEALPQLAAAPVTLAAFFDKCLDLLAALQAAGICHRDIHVHNILVREGQPVLIDFGWAIAPDQPCFTPAGLGEGGRPPDGSFCDVFALGKVFAECSPANSNLFAPLIKAMTATDPGQRITSVPELKARLRALDLPSGWPRPPRFHELRRPFAAPPWQDARGPGHAQAGPPTHQPAAAGQVHRPTFHSPPSDPNSEQVACPFCGSRDTEPFRRSADIVKCAGCETVYLRTRKTQRAMEELYQSYADAGSHLAIPLCDDEAATSRYRREDFLRELLELGWPPSSGETRGPQDTEIEASASTTVASCASAPPPRRGKLLDVGCGWGAFLLNARDHGFEPLGVELTRKAVQYANDRLGIPVVSTQFLDTPYEEDSLAAVTMIHVLEHLPQPKQAIAKVARILQPDGWFCGIVPNIASFCSQHQGEDWFWLDPNYHYVHFSPATLRRHLEAAGFVVERLYTTRGDYNKDRLRQAAQAFAPELADDAAFERWLAQIEAEGRGEEIRFFARKPGKVAAADRPAPRVGITNNHARDAGDAQTPSEPQPDALTGSRARPPAETRLATTPPATLPSVSIIIPVFNQVDFTRRCLETLHRNAPAACPLEVIVVDNASTDGTAEFLEQAAREYPALRVLRQTENLGFARACNLGAASARGRYLVFLNNDTEPQPGWLEAALHRLEQDPNIGVLGVKLLYPDRRVQHCGIEFFRWVNPDYEFWPLHRYRLFSEHDPMVNRPGEVSAVTGACLFIRRDLFEQVHGFSPEYPMYFEDTDLCFKVRQQGRTVFYEPRSVVIHHEGQSSPNRERIDQLNRDAAPIFFRKWERAVRRQANILRHEGRYVYLPQDLLPLWSEQEITTERLTRIAQSLAKFLEEIGPFYMHFGGAGDALLLLATFLDRHPTAQVVSFPNSLPAARSLFDAFPSLKRVYFLPPNPSPQIHLLLRMMMRHVPTFQGMGITPECDYGKEWFEGMDIFKKYGVARRPAWVRAFQPRPETTAPDGAPRRPTQPTPHASPAAPAAGRVVLAPKGSLVGMVGSKRNCIDPQVWPQLLQFVRERGFHPVVIGTPDERALYPVLEGGEDRRSYSFKEQMDLIAGSRVFIGADSWGKTFAALAGLPTIVFDPLKGADWQGKKDPSDFVFIDPWDTIAKVKTLDECRAVFARFTAGAPPEVIGRQWRQRRCIGPTPLRNVRLAWEGSFLDYGSLSHVNRALTDALETQPGLKLVRTQTTPPAAPVPAPLRAYANRLTSSGTGVSPVPASPVRSNAAKRSTRVGHPAAHSDAAPLVTVRHAWPPDWSPAKAGALVIIQPWEYGALPDDWVRQAGHVTQFWVPSEYVRRVYVASGVPAEKVKVVPNGFDPRRFHPAAAPMPLATRKRFKFLFVGGTIPRKGADLLLQTYLDEFTAQDDVCLVVKDFGGQSVYAGQTLEAQIRAAQSRPGAPEILYLNEELPPEALPGLYTACDCLVHPYRGEGFGLPVLEAMACGLPVIVTAGGATDDFATPDVVYPVPAQPRPLGRVLSGMKLAAPGWWLEPIAVTLAAQMRQVFEHPAEARAKGRAAAERARQQWTWDHAARRARQHLEELLAAEGLSLQTETSTVSARARQSADAPNAAPAQSAARNGTLAGHAAPAGAPPPRQTAPVQLPPCALLGHLGEARELLRRKKLREAWEATRAAIDVRPFHPEAYLLLAEIAAAAGDSVSARRCAQHARDLAPGFRPAKQFLKSNPRGSARPDWLHLPEALGAADSPAPKANADGADARTGSRQAPHALRLTVCLITKNEEQFLGQCLQSVREIADQIVVLDTGSTDWTTTIAARFGAEVYSCEWQDDFSAARNAALEHARGDWILFLDADEELLPESRDALLKELRDPSAIAYRLPIVDQGHEDEGRSFVPRLFRNAPGLFYVGRVHEQIFSSLEVRRRQWGLENKLGTATLLHHGYTAEMVRDRRKIERNLRLLQRAVEELPGEPNLLMNLGLELARSGQAEAALARYWEAFEALATLPREHVVPELREALLTQLSTRLIAAKRFSDVVQLLGSPLARAGGLTASLHFALGLALLELKQFAPAAEQMRECLAKRRRPALTPINKEILGAGPQHCLALCLSALQRPAEAEQAFQAALQDDPRSRAARLDYANFLRQQDRPLDALKVLNELIALQPDDPAAWRAGGQIALSRADFLEFAREWTGEAVKFCPQDPVVLNQRAEALTLSEAVTEALPLWRQLRAQQRLAQRAPLVICELLANELGEPFEADDERAVSREFIQWYQRLVQAGARGVVLGLNGRVEALRRRLPSAARLLDAALSEAKTSELN